MEVLVSQTESKNLEGAVTRLILMAELFGTGNRDATGFSSKSNFVVKRVNCCISYRESSGDCYSSGEISVRDEAGNLVLKATRSCSPDLMVGWPEKVGYKLESCDFDSLKKVYDSVARSLVPLGKSGMQLPFFSIG